MSPQPSYEELATLVAVQARVIDELRTENAELRARVVEWERLLGMDSTNSSRPSSNGLGKTTRSQRLRSKDRNLVASRGVRAAVWSG